MTIWIRLSPGSGHLLRTLAKSLAVPHEELARRLLEAAIETAARTEPRPLPA